MKTTKAIPECYFRGPDGCVIPQPYCTYPPAVTFCAATPVPALDAAGLALTVALVATVARVAGGAR